MKIGFVDHHLNNFHANKFLSLLHGPLADLGARVTLAWESDPVADAEGNEDWCGKNEIARAESAETVAATCDAVIILAPDNIEAHLELCRRVFPAGKPCMVDKFLAPTLTEAREIVSLAERYGMRLFSASSLRFAVESEAAISALDKRVTESFARGMGDWGGYGVHTLSLVLSAMGHDVVRVIDTGGPESASVTLDYGDRRGYVEVRSAENMWEALPWSFGYRADGRYVTGQIQDFDGFYANLMRRTVEFFQSGTSPITVDEMLKVVAILERTAESRKQGGVWLGV